MSDFITTVANYFLKAVASCGLYLAPGLTVGGISGSVSLALNFDTTTAWTKFIIGVFIPIGPIYFYFLSERVMKKEFAKYGRLHREGVISDDQLNELCTHLIEWHSQSRFGSLASIRKIEEDSGSIQSARKTA